MHRLIGMRMRSASLMFHPFLFFIIFILYSSSVSVVEASVPSSKTFKYVKTQTSFEPIILNQPFIFEFYNIAPSRNEYVLGLGLGLGDLKADVRWVWSANRGRPVRENATLSFGRNGNLVLVDANGRVAWQTRTANQGVVDIKLLPNGNLVLVNNKGGFVWQSFDYPTDTLLNGQGLRPNGVNNKLVSRLSDVDYSPGPYSLVINGDGKSGIPMYYKSKLSQKQVKYADILLDYNEERLDNLTFFVNSPIPEFGPDYSNQLGLHLEGSTPISGLWAQPKYNSTLSFVQLGWDGNLRVYTYYNKGYWADLWEETYIHFSRDGHSGYTECGLPEKCGSFGLCSKSQCFACPTPNGLTVWTEDCKAPKLPRCNISGGAAAGSTVGSKVKYFEIKDVNFFVDKNPFSTVVDNSGEGPMKMDECETKCSKNCNCVAFFYRKDTSRCLVTTQLNTLNKVVDETSKNHSVFIKYAK